MRYLLVFLCLLPIAATAAESGEFCGYPYDTAGAALGGERYLMFEASTDAHGQTRQRPFLINKDCTGKTYLKIAGKDSIGDCLISVEDKATRIVCNNECYSYRNETIDQIECHAKKN